MQDLSSHIRKVKYFQLEPVGLNLYIYSLLKTNLALKKKKSWKMA